MRRSCAAAGNVSFEYSSGQIAEFRCQRPLSGGGEVLCLDNRLTLDRDATDGTVLRPRNTWKETLIVTVLRFLRFGPEPESPRLVAHDGR